MKWYRLNNCNLCVSLDIAYILARNLGCLSDSLQNIHFVYTDPCMFYNFYVIKWLHSVWGNNIFVLYSVHLIYKLRTHLRASSRNFRYWWISPLFCKKISITPFLGKCKSWLRHWPQVGHKVFGRLSHGFGHKVEPCATSQLRWQQP